MSCIKEFYQEESQVRGRGRRSARLKAVCLNYPDTPEEIESFSRRYYEAMIMGLEMQFGENWGRPAMAKLRELEAKKKAEEEAKKKD